MHPVQKRYFWMFFVLLLAACSPGLPNVKPTQNTNIITPSVDSQVTQIARPTNLPTLTETVTPVLTKTPTITRTPLPFVALDGLRVAYVFKGNIYIQDSGKQPIQLTHSGQDHSPSFSDDGQKIVFNRRVPRDNDQTYTINTNGNQEMALVTGGLLTSLNLGYDKYTELHRSVFVPGTHQLLFDTQEYDQSMSGVGDHSHGKPNNDLLLVDVDSAKIRQIRAPGKAGYFDVSPNGKLIWVLSGDHIDLIGLDGKTRRRLYDYPPLSPDKDITMPDMYWTQDSQNLSLAQPPVPGYMDYAGPELRTSIWQYSLAKGGAGIEIHLTPTPINRDFSISPDGNWIVYAYYYVDGKTELTDKFGVYLGNLRNGTSQLLGLSGLNPDNSPMLSYFWSPDSQHFIVDDDYRAQLYIADINGHITQHNVAGEVSWIDNTHYLYGAVVIGEIGKDTSVSVIEIPSDVVSYPYREPFVFVFLNH